MPFGFDFSVDIDTQEPIGNWDNPNWQMPLLPAEVAGGTARLYDRVIKSVIPVSLTVTVPAHGSSSEGPVDEMSSLQMIHWLISFRETGCFGLLGPFGRHLQAARIRQVLSPHIVSHRRRGTTARILMLAPIGCRRWMSGFRALPISQLERGFPAAHVCRISVICNMFAQGSSPTTRARHTRRSAGHPFACSIMRRHKVKQTIRIGRSSICCMSPLP